MRVNQYECYRSEGVQGLFRSFCAGFWNANILSNVFFFDPDLPVTEFLASQIYWR